MLSATLIAVASLAAVVPVPDVVVREAVDLIEVNAYFDEKADLVFRQVIFYDWEGDRFQVRDWRLVKHPSQLPQRDWERGGYSSTWKDGEQIRCIHSKAIRETWLQYDPEICEREILPKDKRRELRK